MSHWQPQNTLSNRSLASPMSMSHIDVSFTFMPGRFTCKLHNLKINHLMFLKAVFFKWNYVQMKTQKNKMYLLGLSRAITWFFIRENSNVTSRTRTLPRDGSLSCVNSKCMRKCLWEFEFRLYEIGDEFFFCDNCILTLIYLILYTYM